MSDTIIRNGRHYSVTVEPDNGMLGAPWDEFDGHGIVSDWTRRAKGPGEVIISEDHHSRRLYDVVGTLAKARRDGWGLSDDDKAALAARLGRQPTKREITAEAVRLDCNRMRQWCNDIWHWCGVVVTSPDGDERSLWGIESDAYSYIDEVAGELVDELESDRAGEMAASIAASRPDLTEGALA